MSVPVGQQVTTLPAGLHVSADRINDLQLKGTSGYNPVVGATSETICTQGGIRNYLNAAEILKVSSTDANDTNSGSGNARRIRIQGIGADGLEKEADVNMNGTNVVTQDRDGVDLTFLHINNVRVQTTGSGGGTNAGTIKVFANDGTTLLYEIAAGENQQQCASWTMPSDKIGYLTSFVASATGDALISIWINGNPAGANTYQQRLSTIVGAGSGVSYPLPNPFPINASGIIEFRAKSLTGGNIGVAADFQILQERTL